LKTLCWRASSISFKRRQLLNGEIYDDPSAADFHFAGKYDAYMYHYDNEGPGFLKFFFFLTDVAAGTGAHYFMASAKSDDDACDLLKIALLTGERFKNAF
jgi:hypothetical protein